MATQPRLHLREWREHRGLTQEQVAKALRIRRASVAELESPRSTGIKYRRWGQLARIFGCEPGALLKPPK